MVDLTQLSSKNIAPKYLKNQRSNRYRPVRSCNVNECPNVSVQSGPAYLANCECKRTRPPGVLKNVRYNAPCIYGFPELPVDVKRELGFARLHRQPA